MFLLTFSNDNKYTPMKYRKSRLIRCRWRRLWVTEVLLIENMEIVINFQTNWSLLVVNCFFIS